MMSGKQIQKLVPGDPLQQLCKDLESYQPKPISEQELRDVCRQQVRSEVGGVIKMSF